MRPKGALIELARIYYKQARKLRIEMAPGDTDAEIEISELRNVRF